MTSYRVSIDDLSDFSQAMDLLRSEWPSIRERALGEALQMSIEGDIKSRTPRSKKGLPKYKYYANAGLGNLRNDYRLQEVSSGGSRCEFMIGYPNVEYAMAVHEMKDPTASGKAVQWSAPGTGNKFLEKPIYDSKDEIPANICDNIDFMLKSAGVF